MHAVAKDSITIVIAEDYELARSGLALTLNNQNRVKLVGQASNGLEAVEQVQLHQPSVVLMDIGMPVMDGIKATQRIKEEWPTVKVVMLTSHQESEQVIASLSSGADAYCLKDITVERLCHVMELVIDGGIWLDPVIAGIVLATLPKASSGSVQPTPVKLDGHYSAQLTEREQDVLQLIVAGKSNKEIAVLLDISTNTVKFHVGNIIQKLAVDDRTQVAIKALREGLLPATEDFG